MIEPGALLGDLARTGVALLAGYLVGSLPVSAWIGRAAGVGFGGRHEEGSGPAAVWAMAGPGWGLLAVMGDLAKGILPVAIAIVTFTWWTGWVAGIGALVGAAWPARGRRPRGRNVAVLAGVAVALAPVAGIGCLVVSALAALVGRLLGRAPGGARVMGIAAGLTTFPVLFLVEHRDLVRLAGVGMLYLFALARPAASGHALGGPGRIGER
jgi:glycerol-3-phosphate acyltransferase PlsY